MSNILNNPPKEFNPNCENCFLPNNGNCAGHLPGDNGEGITTKKSCNAWIPTNEYREEMLALIK